MVAETITKPDTVLDDTIASFIKSGIAVADAFEIDESGVYQVVFYGDEERGREAVEVGRRIGLYPECLQQVWNYITGEEDNPHWELTFLTEPPATSDEPPAVC